MHLDMIAFSCYIWNIEYIDKLCHMLRQRQPDIILALGGPEVTYEPQYFLEHIPVDYILSGEGGRNIPSIIRSFRKETGCMFTRCQLSWAYLINSSCC